MENTIKVSKIPTIGLAVIIAVIGFTFAACGDGGGGGAGHVHDWGDGWVVVKPATCKDKGSEKRVCVLDPTNHVEERDIDVDPNGHNIENPTETTDATCEEPGKEKGTCIICEENDVTKIIPALGHDYEYVTIPATCTTAGSETGTCTRNLLHTDSRNIDIDPDAHDYQWTVITPATYTTEGEEKEICTHDATHKRGTRAIAILTIPPYIINGSGTAFTATRDGATVGTAEQPIQNVINEIRTDADGEECIIQFGNKTDPLDIGTASASFNNTGGTWGAVTLTGKITGNVNTATTGTIVIADTVSITSTADIANTGGTNGRAVYHNSTGTFTVTSGTVSGETGRAIQNQTTGTVTISGGTVSATTGYAVYNQTTGTVTISGGTVSATTGTAVYSDNVSGVVNVSGTALVTSANSTDGRGTINGSLEMTGGRVENTSTTTNGNAVYTTSTVNISGGTISAIEDAAVVVGTGGKITVSGTALVTSAGDMTGLPGTISFFAYSGGDATVVRLEITGGTVKNTGPGAAVYSQTQNGTVNISGGTISGDTGIVSPNASLIINISGGTITGTTYGVMMMTAASRVNISGGTVKATGEEGFAVRNNSTGAVTITNGTVSATGESGRAIHNNSTGTVTITEGTILAPEASAYTIYNNSTGAVKVTSPPTVIDKDKAYGNNITWLP